MRRLAGAVLAVCLSLTGWGAQAAPAMWVVKDKDSTIYLFGSMHLLQPGVRWRTPAFDNAYKSATTLWFETNNAELTDRAKMGEIVTRLGVDPEHPLSGKLKPETRTTLKARLEAAGVSSERMERMRPWMAALIVTVLPFRTAGFDRKAGADAVINTAAVTDKKTVRAFETAEAQARFLAELPEPVQVQLLEDSLRQDSQGFGDLKTVQTAWLSGDLARLAPLLTAEMRRDRPQLYEVLIPSRNRAWADAIAAEMAGSGVEMVNVGALHMVGADGLPELLKARGFTVERVQ